MGQQRDNDIYASAPLRQLLDAQTRAMTSDLQRCFGMHALLVGAAAEAPPVLPLLGCWTRLRVNHGRYSGDLDAAADESLPFIDNAFDLVLLRHALEAAPAASALLVEAIRVLAPGGAMVVTGVHPLSGWAPWFYWHGRGQRRALQMPFRLMQVLQQAGLEIERTSRVGRMWPVTAATGSTQPSLCGGGYVLFARKRRHMATPLRIKPSPVRVPANGQLSPGTRRSSAL